MIIHLDFKDDIPIYMQIRNQVILGIGRGELSAGESLPTVRVLAQEAGINNMTVNKAYSLLKSEGYIAVDRRHGCTVNPVKTREGAESQLENKLTLAIAEAGLSGITQMEFYSICKRIFKQFKGLDMATG